MVSSADDWTAVRGAAVAATRRGWPVAPGTYPLGEQWIGRQDATRLCPVYAPWEANRTTDPDQALNDWTRRPFSVLLVCGYGVDAIELPAQLADDALAGLMPDPDLAGPVLVLPPDRIVLLVASSPDGPVADLAPWPSITYRGRGTWVALPPTEVRAGVRARWEVPSADGVMDLPASGSVQKAMAVSLREA